MSLKPERQVLDLIDALGYRTADGVSYAYVQGHRDSNLAEAHTLIQEQSMKL